MVNSSFRSRRDFKFHFQLNHLFSDICLFQVSGVMGDNAELQEEELEVLKSIYEGDECYRYLSYQFKINLSSAQFD